MTKDQEIAALRLENEKLGDEVGRLEVRRNELQSELTMYYESEGESCDLCKNFPVPENLIDIQKLEVFKELNNLTIQQLEQIKEFIFEKRQQ